MARSSSGRLRSVHELAERDENGKFTKMSTDEKMNAWMLGQVRNSPGRRRMRLLFDNEARAKAQQEA